MDNNYVLSCGNCISAGFDFLIRQSITDGTTPMGWLQIGNVITLPAGSQATVVNRGTPYNPVLDFGIPQGVQGFVGLQGASGMQGATGEKGDQGATGATGDKGDPGATGDKGDKGDPGDATTSSSVQQLDSTLASILSEYAKIQPEGTVVTQVGLPINLTNLSYADGYISATRLEDTTEYRGVINADSVKSFYFEFPAGIDEIPTIEFNSNIPVTTKEAHFINYLTIGTEYLMNVWDWGDGIFRLTNKYPGLYEFVEMKDGKIIRAFYVTYRGMDYIASIAP